MVEAGIVRREDKRGNDISDEGANRGAEETNRKAVAIGYMYSRRHKLYKTFMQQIQNFIIKVTKAQKEKRQAREKEEDPFGKKEKQHS